MAGQEDIVVIDHLQGLKYTEDEEELTVQVHVEAVDDVKRVAIGEDEEPLAGTLQGHRLVWDDGDTWTHEALQDGAYVTAHSSFLTDEEGEASLYVRRGMRGRVLAMGVAGDAQVKFDSFETPQWVFKESFHHLLVEARPLVGGVHRRMLSDDAISASSSSAWTKEISRLDANGAWAPAAADARQWLQWDLGDLALVTRVHTMGHASLPWFVTAYMLSYSVDGLTWHRHPSLFRGNEAADVLRENAVKPQIKARYLRLHPAGCFGNMALRVELFGRGLGQQELQDEASDFDREAFAEEAKAAEAADRELETELKKAELALQIAQTKTPEAVSSVTEGAVLVVRGAANVFPDPQTYGSIGALVAGQKVVASGPPVDVQGFLMAPIRPCGAVELEKVDLQPFERHSFCIDIVKEDGAELGLSISKGWDSFHVAEVHEGLVQEWNKEHPELTVRPGDCICGVNGVQGKADDLRAAMKGAARLQLLIGHDSPDGAKLRALNEARGVQIPTIERLASDRRAKRAAYQSRWGKLPPALPLVSVQPSGKLQFDAAVADTLFGDKDLAGKPLSLVCSVGGAGTCAARQRLMGMLLHSAAFEASPADVRQTGVDVVAKVLSSDRLAAEGGGVSFVAGAEMLPGAAGASDVPIAFADIEDPLDGTGAHATSSVMLFTKAVLFVWEGPLDVNTMLRSLQRLSQFATRCAGEPSDPPQRHLHLVFQDYCIVNNNY